jgi:hypothetical protein
MKHTHTIQQIVPLEGTEPGNRLRILQKEMLQVAEGHGQLVELIEEMLLTYGIDPDDNDQWISEDPDGSTIVEYRNRPKHTYFSSAAANTTPTEKELDTLAAWLGIITPLGKTAFRTFCECAVLLDQKNRDYGTGNISSFGEKGVLVRSNDKIERLKTLLWGDKHPVHEKVEDSWMDLCNYGCIGLMCHRGDWK